MAGEVTFSLKLSIAEYRAALKRAEEEFKSSMRNTAATAGREGRRTSHAMENLGLRPLKEITREIKRTEASYVRLARSGKLSVQELSRAKLAMIARVRDLKRETSGWAGAITAAKTQLAGAAAAIFIVSSALTGATGDYSQYATKMAEVYTLVDAAPEKFQGVSDGVRKMSKDIGKPAADSAAALYDIISAGTAMEDSLKVLERSTKAAVAGVTDTKTAARAGLAVVNAYGMSMERLSGVYDTLFKTVKSGVTTLPELAQHLGETLPVASAAKVDFKEVAAAVAQMTKSGLRTPQAVTALKGAITALSAPAPEAKKKLQELDITWKGFTETIRDISALKLTAASMREIIPDVEARTAVLALTNNYKGLVSTLDEMQNAAGAMSEAYGKMEQTPARKIEKLTASFKEMGLQLGELISTLTPVAEVATGFLEILNSMPAPIKGGAAGIIALAGGTVLWKIALKDTYEILRSATLALGGYTTAAKAAAAANLASGMAPARAALAGIATSAKAAAVAMGPFAIGAGVAAAGAIGITYAFKKLNEDLDKTIKNTEGVGKALKNFGDLKNQLSGIGLGDSPLAKQISDMRLLMARAASEGADIESAAAKKIKASFEERVTAAKRMYGQLIRAQDEKAELEKKLAAEVKKETIKNLEEAVTAAKAAAQKRIEAEREASRAAIDAERETLAAKKDALAKAKEAERDYAAEAKRLAGEIKSVKKDAADFQQSIADKLRELARKGMTDAQKEADTLAAIEREKEAARQASANGDAEAAKQHTKRAAALTDELANEEKKKKTLTEVANLYGNIAERQAAALGEAKAENEKNLSATRQKITDIEEAIAASEAAIKTLETAFEALKKNIEEGAAKQVAKLKTELAALKKEDTVTQIKADISAADSEIAKLKAELEKLKQGVDIPLRAKPEGKFNSGGPVAAFAGGGQVFGPSGIDQVPALLTRGEWVIRKAAVDALGHPFLNAINNLDFSSLRRFPAFDIPDIPLRFAQGGPVPALANSGPVETFRIEIGGAGVTTTSSRSEVRRFVDMLREQGRGLAR